MEKTQENTQNSSQAHPLATCYWKGLGEKNLLRDPGYTDETLSK